MLRTKHYRIQPESEELPILTKHLMKGRQPLTLQRPLGFRHTLDSSTALFPMRPCEGDPHDLEERGW